MSTQKRTPTFSASPRRRRTAPEPTYEPKMAPNYQAMESEPPSVMPAPGPEPAPIPVEPKIVPPTKPKKYSHWKSFYGTVKERQENLALKPPKKIKEKKKKKEKAPKPRREKFYSESHPKGFKTLKSLPYIPLLFVLLLYWMPILSFFKYFTGILISGVIFQQTFWQSYGASFSMVLTLIIGTLSIFYYFIWRMIWPDYMVRYNNTDVYDGRLYWSDSSGIVKWWDKVYRSPERKVIRHWVHQRFIPLTPTVIYTTPDEWIEKRDTWSIVAHEKQKREIIKKERKRLHVRTLDGGYVGHEVSMTYAQGNFAARSQELRDATTYLSQSNAHVQVDAVKGSTVRISEDFKRRVLDARRKQRETNEQSAAQPDN